MELVCWLPDFAGPCANNKKKSSSARGNAPLLAEGAETNGVVIGIPKLFKSGIGLINTISPFSFISKLDPVFETTGDFTCSKVSTGAIFGGFASTGFAVKSYVG